MYLWRRTASERWLRAREEILQTRSGSTLAIISKPNRKRLLIEIVCKSRDGSQKLIKEFGGSARKLPRDWLKRLACEEDGEPIKIGRRLIVSRAPKRREAVSFPYSLTIPAGLAFGTGEHATTAMSLRLLEKLTRTWTPGWSIADLGTGTGIIALAAKRFGAGRVLGLDIDPTAIATARENARLNKIAGVDFRVTDARSWRPGQKIDVIAANLFSELLIGILPKLKRAQWLILSGILRAQERQIVQKLRRNQVGIVALRRRGKWIALLARATRPSVHGTEHNVTQTVQTRLL